MARGEVRTASRCAGTLPAFLGPRAEPLRAVAPERVLGITLTAPQEKAWAQERAPGYAARRGVACQEGQPTTPQIQGCQCFSMGAVLPPEGMWQCSELLFVAAEGMLLAGSWWKSGVSP